MEPQTLETAAPLPPWTPTAHHNNLKRHRFALSRKKAQIQKKKKTILSSSEKAITTPTATSIFVHLNKLSSILFWVIWFC